MNDRNRYLLDMARGRDCLLRIPGVCNYNPETTVACHSNQQQHGKGMGIKAHDWATAWGCSSCHAWLDQGMADKADKAMAFKAAMARQEAAWLDVCKHGKPKDRQAAKWALTRLWANEEGE